MNIRYMSYDQRKELEAMYAANAEINDIAARLGVNHVTVYRELKRGETGELDKNERMAYSAELGQKTLNENFRRRGKSKSYSEKRVTIRHKKGEWIKPMSEILFRGKDSSGILNHGWCFGSLDTTENSCEIIFLDRFENKCRVSIDPKIAGQYTGLNDKNGKKIFEGDILRTRNGHVGWVEFNDGKFSKRCSCHQGSRLTVWEDNEAVIGNIYDDPELLDGQ